MKPSPILLALSACALLSACAPKQAPKPNVSVEAKTSSTALPIIGPAPFWKLKDVNGNAVSSDEFKGKVVVVDFWATWCPPCRSEIPGYVDLYRKYGKDLVIVGISMDEGGPQVVKDFIGKFGVNYPIVMAEDAVVSAFGGMEAIPTTFLIDRNGQIRDRKVGAEATADYEKKIESLLN